ncbi:cation channel family protein (macronuclear) [Tetrahymena thermophila SB210]|uniref:Cation channel family protein n=1 Tax=Tetrahymena thermophila (strain SB210) TaxID=312017 RepID=Q22AP6_TETTS|nr:cation channel family protein [Tetrahymena thermophila SB210]EAR82348.1 cation channel family protein [Tetrahymena thermophila SB210]|eukprot:XP_001030011.1 cation channel family protein [Tetrahymena thermophila SB210]
MNQKGKTQFEQLTNDEKVALFGEPTKHTLKLKNIKVIDRQISKTLQEFIKLNRKDTKQQSELFLQKFVIKLDNKYKSFWDIFVLLTIAYNVATVAFYVTFDTIEALQIVDIIVEVVFGLDIILRFFHEYKDPESFEIVSDIKRIAHRYLRFWFWIDIVALIPWDVLLAQGQSLKLIRLARLPKFLRLLEAQKMDDLLDMLLEKFSQKQKMNYIFFIRYLYKFMKFVIFAIALTYFIGCIWYLVVTYAEKDSGEVGFIEKYGINFYDNKRKLVICCYFVMTTITTVGYGDYTPQSNNEKIVGIIIMILGIAFFSYIMGNFTDVLTSQKKLGEGFKSSDLQRWLTSLSKFNSKPLPQSLVQKIDDHFNYFWKHDRLCDLKKDDKYLLSMPKPVRKDLINYLFYDIYKLFRGFFHLSEFQDSNFFYELSFEILPRKYNPKDYIIKQGEEFQEIYFIMEGEMRISFNYEEKEVFRTLTRGHYFGDYNIFYNQSSQYDYSAHTLLKVLAIPKHRFIKLLEKYVEIKNKIYSYSFQFYKQQNKAMLLKLKQVVREITKDKPNEEDVLKIFKQEVIQKVSKNQANVFPFKIINSGETLSLNEVEENILQLEQQIDSIAYKINLIKSKIEKEIDEIADSVQGIKMNMLESES